MIRRSTHRPDAVRGLGCEDPVKEPPTPKPIPADRDLLRDRIRPGERFERSFRKVFAERFPRCRVAPTLL